MIDEQFVDNIIYYISQYMKNVIVIMTIIDYNY